MIRTEAMTRVKDGQNCALTEPNDKQKPEKYIFLLRYSLMEKICDDRAMTVSEIRFKSTSRHLTSQITSDTELG